MVNVMIVNASGAVSGVSGTIPSISNSISELTGTISGFVVPMNITVSPQVTKLCRDFGVSAGYRSRLMHQVFSFGGPLIPRRMNGCSQR